jgi:hypothetical protein
MRLDKRTFIHEDDESGWAKAKGLQSLLLHMAGSDFLDSSRRFDATALSKERMGKFLFMKKEFPRKQ